MFKQLNGVTKLECYFCNFFWNNFDYKTKHNILVCYKCKKYGCKHHFFIEKYDTFWCKYSVSKKILSGTTIDVIKIKNITYELKLFNANKLKWCNTNKNVSIKDICIFNISNEFKAIQFKQVKINNFKKKKIYNKLVDDFNKKKKYLQSNVYNDTFFNIKYKNELINQNLWCKKIKHCGVQEFDYGMKYIQDVFHHSIHEQFKDYIEYFKHVIKRDGFNVIGVNYNTEHFHYNAFHGFYKYENGVQNYKISLLNEKEKSLDKRFVQYSKIFIDYFYQNWKQVNKICTGK